MMRILPLLFLAAVMAGGIVLTSASADRGLWLNDLSEAKRAAMETGRPILLVFR